jgi:tRNAThr (cytosine32-N3)-methyltransferase
MQTTELRDNVEWDEEQEKHALSQIERQTSSPVPEELRGNYTLYDIRYAWGYGLEIFNNQNDYYSTLEQYHSKAADYWNKFYHINENRFFKDRNWLRLEFPELFRTLDPAVRNSVPLTSLPLSVTRYTY